MYWVKRAALGSAILLATLVLMLWVSPALPASAAGTIESCDFSGNPKDNFAPGETVYVKGSGLAATQYYDIWIQPDPVGEDDAIAAGNDPSGAEETVQTDSSGNLAITAIWINIPSAPPENYDIVADWEGSGNGVYNAADDGLDSASTVGFTAPIPELSTLLLLGVGLAAVGFYTWLRVRRRHSNLEEASAS